MWSTNFTASLLSEMGQQILLHLCYLMWVTNFTASMLSDVGQQILLHLCYLMWVNTINLLNPDQTILGPVCSGSTLEA